MKATKPGNKTKRSSKSKPLSKADIKLLDQRLKEVHASTNEDYSPVLDALTRES